MKSYRYKNKTVVALSFCLLQTACSQDKSAETQESEDPAIASPSPSATLEAPLATVSATPYADPYATVTPIVSVTAGGTALAGFSCDSLIGKWTLNDPDAPNSYYHEYKSGKRLCFWAFGGSESDCPNIDTCAPNAATGLVELKLRNQPSAGDRKFCSLRLSQAATGQPQYEMRCAQAAFPTDTTSPLKYTKQ